MSRAILEGMTWEVHGETFDDLSDAEKLGLMRDQQRALRWLAENADNLMTIEAMKAHELADINHGEIEWMKSAIRAALLEAAKDE